MPEYAPLLAAGFQDVQLDDFDRIFVDPFTDKVVRGDLVSNFRRFVAHLRSLGVSGLLWIDGSFVTEKPQPGDVDVVLLVDNTVLQNLSSADLDKFRKMVHNKRETKLRFKCDLYFCDPSNDVWRSYWRGWFGFSRSEEAKGMARLAI